MITLRRAGERHHLRLQQQEVWQTFALPDPADPLATGFGLLEALAESRLAPGARAAPLPRLAAEIVTHVLHGALAQEDSTGRSSLLQAGDFQRLSTSRRVTPRERNASRRHEAHTLRLTLYPSEPDAERTPEQKLFSVATRRGDRCLIGSPDGRQGSLTVHQDALIYSIILDIGHHLVHELQPGRSAWLHVVEGEIKLADLILTTGDGTGFTEEYGVSLTARNKTELLLLDLGPAPGRPPGG
jgi:hypothetical protein